MPTRKGTIKTDKVFDFSVDLVFEQRIYAKNYKEAVEKLKESFKQDFNLDVEDTEITKL